MLEEVLDEKVVKLLQVAMGHDKEEVRRRASALLINRHDFTMADLDDMRLKWAESGT